MSDVDSPVSETGVGVGTGIDWDDLSEDAKIQAISLSIEMLAQQGYAPFEASEISEALGPDQLRLMAASLSEDQMQAIATHISAEDVVSDPKSQENSEAMDRRETELKHFETTMGAIFDSVALTGAAVTALMTLVAIVGGAYVFTPLFVVGLLFFLYAYHRGLKI